MTVGPSELSAAILGLREELVSSGRFASHRAINSGHCTRFCKDVLKRLGVPPDADEPFELGIDNLMRSEDDDPTVMDRELLAAYWPKVQPPEGLDWDDVDRLAGDAVFSSGMHVWLCLGDRHYDAEAPYGVENPFDLPFFQRMVSWWVEERQHQGPRT